MSIGHGSGVIDRAWVDQLRQQIASETTVNRDYNVPLGGGSSTDGKTVYVDRAIPDAYKERGGKLVPVTDYLVIHEFVEKRLLDGGLTYLPAHACATASELAAVQDDGYDVAQYDAFWDKWLKVTAKHKLGEGTPPDIETRPYEES